MGEVRLNDRSRGAFRREPGAERMRRLERSIGMDGNGKAVTRQILDDRAADPLGPARHQCCFQMMSHARSSFTILIAAGARS